MTRKPFFPGLLLCLGYCLIFIILGIIQFSGTGRTVSEKVIDGNPSFNPVNFTLPQAQNSRDFITYVSRWQDGNFIAWNRLISQQNDEDMVIAFAQEALDRSSYSAAITAIPGAFLTGNRRTYESSVYLGQLDAAYKSLSVLEQEKLSRLANSIQDESGDFLSEPGILDYLTSRGHSDILEETINLIRSMDPETLTLDIVPGILEGYNDWKKSGNTADNPFDPLLDRTILEISESIRINSDRSKVFAVNMDTIDPVFNIYLGKVLLDWAESEKSESWAGLARSIIVSVLGLENYTGFIHSEYLISPEGEITENPDSPRISTARLYRILDLGEYSPRAASLNIPQNNIWVWTAGRGVNAVMNGNVIDVSVSFPSGETHYMIFRGIRPFSRIQLYGMDYRSDPQFERYDSSGWSYIPAEQTLLVKMKHRTVTEHILIYF